MTTKKIIITTSEELCLKTIDMFTDIIGDMKELKEKIEHCRMQSSYIDNFVDGDCTNAFQDGFTPMLTDADTCQLIEDEEIAGIYISDRNIFIEEKHLIF